MTTETLAWLVRTVMVAGAAVVAFLLVQTDVELDPVVRVALGAVAVALAAINPSTVATKVNG